MSCQEEWRIVRVGSIEEGRRERPKRFAVIAAREPNLYTWTSDDVSTGEASDDDRFGSRDERFLNVIKEVQSELLDLASEQGGWIWSF